MSQRARRLAMAWAIGALALASTAEAARVESLFPTDRLTVADGEQATGRRVALPLPPCGADDAGCHEVQLLNQLDGFSVNPRLSLRFSGPIALATVRRESAFVLPVFGEPLPSPVGLVQLVWDEEQRTLYARTERALLQARRYALVITSRVLDIEGKPLQPAAELLGRGAVPAALEPALWARLDELRVSRREVVAVAVFTTQSVTRDLERIRALVDSRPAPTLSFRLEPGGGRSVYQRAALESIELRRQVSVVVGQLLGKPVTFPLAHLPPSEVRTIAFGRFRSLNFLTSDRYLPSGPSANGGPRPHGEEEVHVTVFLPFAVQPEQGFPVAIFGHGFGNDRHIVPALVAATMARHGFATVAINVVGHGGGPEGRLTVAQAGRPPVVLPAGGRGVDLDGDGIIEPTEGVATTRHGTLALISNRDGLKQTTADLMQLVRALRRGVDVNGDGRRDLDGSRIYYFGHSFGGIYGTLLMAVDPTLPVGVLSVPGGPIVDVARLSSVFRPVVVDILKARRPPLMNGARDFHEAIPLPGEPAMITLPAGALDIQTFFDRGEWLGQSASPVAFAPYLKQAPLAGVPAKAVLYQVASGDVTVPNPTTANILSAGLLWEATSLYRHDAAMPGLPARLRDPHGFLVWTTFPEVEAIARAAQEQVARFFLSAGERIERTHERFEVPARPPLGR